MCRFGLLIIEIPRNVLLLACCSHISVHSESMVFIELNARSVRSLEPFFQ